METTFSYHKILERQLRKFFGKHEQVPEELLPFLQIVNLTYQQFEEEKKLLNNTMDVGMKELSELNQAITEQKNTLEAAYRQLAETESKLSQAEQIIALSHELEGKNRQLTINEEELRQNLEELVSIQEKLEIKQRELSTALAENKAVTRALDNSAIVSIADLNGKITKVNRAFCEVSGYTEQELLGQDHRIVNSGYHSRAFWVQMWKTIAQGHTWRAEVCNRAKDGSIYWVDAVINPIYNQEGKIHQYLSIRYLITERKAEQARKEQTAAKTQQYNAITNQLSAYDFESTESSEEIYRIITEFAAKNLQTARSSVWLYQSDQTAIVCHDLYLASTDEHQRDKTSILLQDYPQYFKALQKQPLIAASDAHQHPATAEFSDSYLTPLGIRSVLDVPIIVNGTTLGILSNEHTAVKEWAPEDITFAQAMANFIALGIQTLERKKARHELRHTLHELQNAQEQLVHAEKMASLGQLIASVAHEINTPLGAIRSSANNVTGLFGQTLKTMPELLRSLSVEQRAYLDELIELASQPRPGLSTREKRSIRYDLMDKLEAAHVAHADTIADQLVEMNIHNHLVAIVPLLSLPNGRQILDMAFQISAIHKSTATITTAVEKAAKVVFALKNFARQDHTGTKQRTNLNDNIETVLILYQNQLKQGIDIIRQYGDLPELYTYADELVQVWTNVIHNAIHAMNGSGTLTITTSIERKDLVVSIKDTGTGIPEAVRDKIFDPFFTTKKAGEGSGLGMDIARKIVEKHEGMIWFETELHVGTTFFVRIPVVLESPIS